MESPWAAGIPVTVLALVVFSPQPPAIVYDVAWLPAAPAAAWVLVKVLGRGVRRTVWVLAASLAVTPFAGALGALPFTDRLTTVLQTAPLAAVLALDLYRGRLASHAGAGRAAALLKAVLWFLAGCLGLSAAGSLVGRVGLATVLGSGALGTLGGIVLIVATYLVASGLLRSLLASGPAQELRMVREHADLVAETCLAALRVLGLLVVLSISIKAFGIGTWLGSALSGFLGAKATRRVDHVLAGLPPRVRPRPLDFFARLPAPRLPPRRRGPPEVRPPERDGRRDLGDHALPHPRRRDSSSPRAWPAST